MRVPEDSQIRAQGRAIEAATRTYTEVLIKELKLNDGVFADILNKEYSVKHALIFNSEHGPVFIPFKFIVDTGPPLDLEGYKKFDEENEWGVDVDAALRTLKLSGIARKSHMSPASILAVPGAGCLLAEELNNEVLEAWAEDHPEYEVERNGEEVEN